MALPVTEPYHLPKPDAIGDAELVARGVRGDRWGRDALYRRHVRYVFAIALRLLACRSEAEEVVQDAFIRAFSQLDNLREPAAFRAWLAQIVVSLVQRRLRRARLMRLLGIDRSINDASLADLADPHLHPDERTELSLIDRLLRDTRVELRIAWVLRRVQDLPVAEVASACGCSLATAKRRIAAVDERLRQHIEFDEGAP